MHAASGASEQLVKLYATSHNTLLQAAQIPAVPCLQTARGGLAQHSFLEGQRYASHAVHMQRGNTCCCFATLTHTRMTACCYCSVPLCQHKRDEVKDAHPTGIASAEKRKRSKPLKDTHPEHRATEHQRTDGRQLQPAAMAARHMQCAFVRIHAVPCRAGVS